MNVGIAIFRSPAHNTFHLHFPRYCMQCLDWIIPAGETEAWGKGFAEIRPSPIRMTRLLRVINSAY